MTIMAPPPHESRYLELVKERPNVPFAHGVEGEHLRDVLRSLYSRFESVELTLESDDRAANYRHMPLADAGFTYVEYLPAEQLKPRRLMPDQD